MSASIQQLEASVGESQVWCEGVISQLSEAQRLEFYRRARIFRALKAQYLQVHEQLVLRENERRAEYRFAVPIGLMIVAGIAIFREMNFEMMGIAALIVGLLIGLEQSLWKIEAKQSWLAITGIEKELSVIGVE
jgi:hypothetical protein